VVEGEREGAAHLGARTELTRDDLDGARDAQDRTGLDRRADRLEEQLARVNEVQYQLTSQGRLDVTLLLERASTKLQLLIDRIKTASYGYAGFFDAIKVDEDALDKLYRFDERMLDASDELEITVGRLVEAIQGEEPIIEQANGLIRQLENLNDTYSKRQDVLLA